MKSNFRGRRYKCLMCYDYDLCGACRDTKALSGRHTVDHAMQCILTRADMGKYSSEWNNILCVTTFLLLQNYTTGEMPSDPIRASLSPVLTAERWVIPKLIWLNMLASNIQIPSMMWYVNKFSIFIRWKKCIFFEIVTGHQTDNVCTCHFKWRSWAIYKRIHLRHSIEKVLFGNWKYRLFLQTLPGILLLDLSNLFDNAWRRSKSRDRRLAGSFDRWTSSGKR